MQKQSKTKLISIFTALSMLLTICFMFASCGDGANETLKYNITITGENGEVLCNLTEVELTGSNLSVLDATQNACEIVELTFITDASAHVEQIGNLKEGVQGAGEAAEPETDENGEEIPTEEVAASGDYYFWEVSVNSQVLETGPAEHALSDGSNITWKWVIYDETAFS